MEPDQRFLRKKALPLLVIEHNKDHQLLICYCLRAKVPQADPIIAGTTKEALAFLEFASIQQNDFPQLILLDLYLPTLTDGFTLLKQIRASYASLPIIVFSSQQEKSVIDEAYQSGAHSFLRKPTTLDDWENQFHVLNQYWLHTVTLPKER